MNGSSASKHMPIAHKRDLSLGHIPRTVLYDSSSKAACCKHKQLAIHESHIAILSLPIRALQECL